MVFFDCMICKFNFHQPPDGVNDSNVEPMRRPKPMTDLSIMMNRNRTQNRTPENNMNQDNRTPSGGSGADPWGKGTGNPTYDAEGNVVRHSTTLTLDPTKVTMA